MTIKEWSQSVRKLPFDERAAMLRTLFTSLGAKWPGIEKKAGVCGGDACIVRTRIPIWMLEGWRRGGMTDGQLLSSYPTLNNEDLTNAWAYVATHRREIDKAIRGNDAA